MWTCVCNNYHFYINRQEVLLLALLRQLLVVHLLMLVDRYPRHLVEGDKGDLPLLLPLVKMYPSRVRYLLLPLLLAMTEEVGVACNLVTDCFFVCIRASKIPTSSSSHSFPSAHSSLFRSRGTSPTSS